MVARRRGLPRPPQRRGAMKRPATAAQVNSLREGQAPGARASGPSPRQVAVEPGGLAGFARGISQSFARGQAEAGRQIGSVMPKSGGRTDPLAKGTLGADVNRNRGKSWINR
jgi:hypothetical protein